MVHEVSATLHFNPFLENKKFVGFGPAGVFNSTFRSPFVAESRAAAELLVSTPYATDSH